jgi:dUTP pyrophosphatase
VTTIEFVRLHPAAKEPRRAHDDDAGWDLTAVAAATLEPGRRALIPTGIALVLPSDTAALVVPRSGLARDHGIGVVNAPGLIDPGYRGEIGVLLVNHDPVMPFAVEAGMRIAQLVLLPIPPVQWQERATLPESTRGHGGFGSSGVTG